MHSLEELEKKCRLYHLKRWGMGLLVLLAIGGAGVYIFQSVPQKETKILQQKKRSLPAKTPKKEKREKVCYALQTYFGYGKSPSAIKRLEKLKKKLEAEGLQCQIVQMEKESRNILKLHCNIASTKEELLPWLQYARSHGIDAVIVHGDCAYASRQPPPPPMEKISENNQSTHAHKAAKTAPKNELLQSMPSAIGDLVKAYQSRPNFSLALQIAKEYYNQHNYDKAIEWAQKANRLDRYSEDAWILYAKGLYQKGQKKKAIDMLRFFLKFQNSSKAKNLLKEWS